MTEEKEVEIINNISLLHNNQEIIQLGCKILYDFIKVLINGNSKFKAINNLKEKNYEKYYSQNSIDYYKRIISGNIKEYKISDLKNDNFIVNILEIIIWIIMTTNSFEEAIEKASGTYGRYAEAVKYIDPRKE